METSGFEDLTIPIADGSSLTIRPPSLLDQRKVTEELSKDGPIPDDPKDPKTQDFTLRMLYRCARWPNGSTPPSYEEFLGMIPIKSIVRRAKAIADFFGAPETPPSTPLPSSDSA